MTPPPALPPDLPADLQTLWDAYRRAETDRVRAVSVPALNRFIDALRETKPAFWESWARDTARAIADDAAPVMVRFPLFQRVFLPALREGVLAGRFGCARWFAHFEPYLRQVKPSPMPPGLQTAEELLKEALRVDPGDQRARLSLLRRWAGSLDYALHELPSGVLYGHNGATADECDRLLDFLSDFRREAALAGLSESYASLMHEADFHFRRRGDYLRAGRPTGSYAAYLETKGAEPRVQ